MSVRDTAHVLAIAQHESGFNPYAAAGTTTASGLGQFIRNTGKNFGINGKTRWNISVQAEALVQHYIENKALAKKRGVSESYIYKFHHDGPTHEFGGLQLLHKYIVPKIRKFTNAIQKIY